MFVNSQLVCLPPVGIRKHIMFSWYICFFHMFQFRWNSCELSVLTTTKKRDIWTFWTFELAQLWTEIIGFSVDFGCLKTTIYRRTSILASFSADNRVCVSSCFCLIVCFLIWLLCRFLSMIDDVLMMIGSIFVWCSQPNLLHCLAGIKAPLVSRYALFEECFRRFEFRSDYILKKSCRNIRSQITSFCLVSDRHKFALIYLISLGNFSKRAAGISWSGCFAGWVIHEFFNAHANDFLVL